MKIFIHRNKVTKEQSNIGRIGLLFFLWMSFSINIQSQSHFVERSGDVLQIAIPTTALALEFVKYDPKGLIQFGEAFAFNFFLTHGVKRLINKERPNGGKYSFPSGHTSTAFMGASFIHIRHGFKYSIPAYILSGYVGWSRIDANKHDFVDVVGGAIVGIGSSLIFARKKKQENLQLEIGLGRIDFSLKF